MSFQIQLGNKYTVEKVSLGPQKKPSTDVLSDYCKIFVFVVGHSYKNEQLSLCSVLSVGLFCSFLSWVVIF